MQIMSNASPYIMVSLTGKNPEEIIEGLLTSAQTFHPGYFSLGISSGHFPGKRKQEKCLGYMSNG